jgi:hypothetical protein
LEELEKPNKRSLDGEDEAIDISGTPKGVGEKERPIGTKQAKKQRAMVKVESTMIMRFR